MSAALLFPGQGSQEPGMGRDLAEADRDSMDLWKKAEQISGIELRAIYWEGSAADMAETRNLQPALTVTNLNLWRHLSGKMKPSAVAGHSLGEFSALAAAGTLPTERVLELVSLRGRLMSQVDPDGKGGMAAVLMLALDQVETCVEDARKATDDVILVANLNTPSQFVVSGGKTAVKHVCQGVKKFSGRALELPVSGAFHSPMMAEAAAEFSRALDGIKSSDWNSARFDVYCNAEPVPLRDPEAVKALLARQMVSSVRWIDSIRNQWDNGCRCFVECGPKGVLSRMVAPILQAHAPAAEGHSPDNPAWRAMSVARMRDAEAFVPWP